MFECEKCGGILSEDDKYCSSCGFENKNYVDTGNVSNDEKMIEDSKEVIEDPEEIIEDQNEMLEESNDVSNVDNEAFAQKSDIYIDNSYNFTKEIIKNQTKKAIICNFTITTFIFLLTIIVYMKRITHTSIFIVFLIVGYVVSNFSLLVQQRLYIKTKMPWWGVYVPIYNYYLVYKLGYKNAIPLIIYIIITITSRLLNNTNFTSNIVFAIILIIASLSLYVTYITGICDRFNKSTKYKAFSIIFPVISLIILAFDDSVCEGEL